MNLESQRIAIAKALGKQLYYWRATWKRMGRPRHIDRLRTKEEAEHYLEREDGAVEEYLDVQIVPNYPGDLNAMHEAEKAIDKMPQVHVPGVGVCDQIEVYDDILGGLCDQPIRATAAQRAEAFLRTLGLWVDETPATNKEENK